MRQFICPTVFLGLSPFSPPDPWETAPSFLPVGLEAYVPTLNTPKLTAPLVELLFGRA